jgi:hypothetical protein
VSNSKNATIVFVWVFRRLSNLSAAYAAAGGNPKAVAMTSEDPMSEQLGLVFLVLFVLSAAACIYLSISVTSVCCDGPRGQFP